MEKGSKIKFEGCLFIRIDRLKMEELALSRRNDDIDFWRDDRSIREVQIHESESEVLAVRFLRLILVVKRDSFARNMTVKVHWLLDSVNLPRTPVTLTAASC